jgi:hypothetical protein
MFVMKCCGAVSCDHAIFACARLMCMRSLVRILMLWLLIASLPMQGIAAAMNIPCALTHGAMANPGIAPMEGCDEPGMIMPAAERGPQEQVSTGTTRHDMPCNKDSSQKHSSCRTCSACHIGAFAPPSYIVSAPAVTHFTDDYTSPTSSVKGWIPARIDRPPRL